mmetsp:Transcript_37520/g.49332  ORF Transcript_37520/g.49332 Transcript_37520/m.49332 type:complete len:250 (+) Transcript_37520:45-794(+)
MESNMNFDNEVLAYLSTRKVELMEQHDEYISEHNEIREVLNDFLSSVLLHKPDDVFVFAKEYFHSFNPTPLKNKPLILVGPSGVGKRTLIDLVLQEYGDIFDRKKSYTTRQIREGNEKAQGNYYFIGQEAFQHKVAQKDFIEHRELSDGCWYGTSITELDRIKASGKIPIIEVDVEGAIEINRQALEGNFLFIYPPSFEELRHRIGNRIETEQEFKIRIREAIRQIEMANNSVLFTNRLVNDTIEDAKD